jgi:hypothetical protein
MASSEHLRVFIGNHITCEPSGALCSAAQCTGELRFPTVRETATERLRMLTGTFGFHRSLRTPEPLREFTGSFHKRLAFRGSPHQQLSSDDFGLPPCVITATEHFRMLTGTFGFHQNLLEIQKPPPKVTA